MKEKIVPFFHKLLLLLLKAAILFFVSSILIVLLYRFANPPVTPLMVIKWFHGNKIEKEWKNWDEISVQLPLAVIASEDQNFLNHSGFDFRAIEKAMENNKKKKRVKGASTISQQTAKNVFLWPARNWLRKGLEVYFTFLIEVFWGKKRILEVYLNVIETGKGIYGAQTASQKYFNKNSDRLTANQAALIAACLPNPVKFNAGKPSAYVLKRKHWILNQMKNLGIENEIKNL